MGGEQYVIGVDFGTLSGRALVVRVSDGARGRHRRDRVPARGDDRELPERRGAAAGLGAPGSRTTTWRCSGRPSPRRCAAAGIDPADVIGIGTDFTACTILPVFADGTPLCEVLEYRDRPHAYVKLWKHHAAQPQADRINALAAERGGEPGCRATAG